MPLSFEEFKRNVLDRVPDNELSQGESAALHFLSVPGNIVSQLSDEELQQFIDAVGGIGNWLQLRSTAAEMFRSKDNPNLISHEHSRDPFELAQIHDSEPLAFAAGDSEIPVQRFPRTLKRLKRIDHAGTYWDKSIAAWDDHQISTALAIDEDSVELWFLNRPAGWEFAGSVLTQPDQRPYPADFPYFPVSHAKQATLLGGADIEPAAIDKVAIYVFGDGIEPFGCIVMALE